MNDPYLDNNLAFERLWTEYKKYGKIIVACDFDDTVFDFHKAGHTYQQVIDLLLECQKLNFYICVFTGTDKAKWPEIYSYMLGLGIIILSINENPFPMPFGNHGKMYYNILLDDRAGLSASYEILKKVVDKAKEKE